MLKQYTVYDLVKIQILYHKIQYKIRFSSLQWTSRGLPGYSEGKTADCAIIAGKGGDEKEPTGKLETPVPEGELVAQKTNCGQGDTCLAYGLPEPYLCKAKGRLQTAQGQQGKGEKQQEFHWKT